MSGKAGDPRNTAAWRRLRAQVIREEPVCWLTHLGWSCCTTVSTTADHVLTVLDRPDLALVRGNVRGACAPCNHRRNKKRVSELEPERTSRALAFFG